MKARNFVIAIAIVAMAATSFGQLSMEKADWARGPVQFLMTPAEKTQWNAVKSDAEADKFMALFWARRDPTPATPRNEFKEDFDRRVEAADKNFGSGRQRGALSDRGKILILFGAPTRPITRSGGQGQMNGRPPSPGESMTDDANMERQIWTYDGQVAEKLFGAPHVEFHFVDRLGNRDLKLEPPRIDLNAAQQRVITAEITQPNLTELPAYQTQPPAAQQPVPAAPAAPVTTLKTAALETAVADARAGKIASKGALISYVEFVSPTGEYYVPAGLYIPAAAGITADAADTFFGVVDDASGKRVLAFEEPAKLIESPKATAVVVETTTKMTSPTTALSVSKPVVQSSPNLFISRTLDLATGKYTATFGLAKGGAPLLMASAPLDVTALTKDSVGTSKLVLSNDIQTTTTQAPVKTPYAFGQLLIVPKADFRFTNKDDLNYFVELHNPGIDPTTNAPKLQMKIELVDAKGKTVAGAPLADTEAAPLSGQAGAGEYAIVSGIPLSQMTKPLVPGEYTMKMKIVDTISKQSYNLEQKFRITA